MKIFCLLALVVCAAGTAAQTQESGTEAEDKNFIRETVLEKSVSGELLTDIYRETQKGLEILEEQRL